MSAARGALLALAVATAIGAGACGGSDDPDYCADRDALQQSLADLRDVDVRADGVGALETQLRRIQSDANALLGSARAEFEPEAAALSAAIGNVEAAGRAAVADPSAQSLSDLAAGVSTVTAAFGELSDAVSSSC